MQMRHHCPSYSCLLRVQNDGCSRAGLRLMTQLHYNTPALHRANIVYVERQNTLHTNATLFNPSGISET